MIDKKIMARVNKWLDGNYDENFKDEIRELLKNNTDKLVDSFYKDLEFGTGGMRGIMGAGTNRMNIYTIGMATQGLCNYLKMKFPKQQIKLAIAYDCRHNNTLFAKTTADVCSANGIKVYLFDGMRPTPELSFALRYLNCQSGIVITASHNPKEYNGYKVYWDDGAQLVTPHDKNVIDEVQKINDISDVKFDGNDELIEIIGDEIDIEFLKEVKKQLLSDELENKDKIKIVFTPLHGTGAVMVPRALKENGYKNTFVVEEQMIADGDFPTAKSPNPEEPAALEMAITKAKKLDADIVMATDPDADRIGIAVKDQNNEYLLLNGNQTGAIIMEYILSKWKEKNLLKGNEFTVKTIVTSELIKDISDYFKILQFDTLTGFKWIADAIRKNENSKIFIVGLEESFGYMIGDFVRDKDSVTAALIIAEIAANAEKEGKTLFDKLIDVYLKYGFYFESLFSIYKHGKSGAEEITKMMIKFRNYPPTEIAGSKVVAIKDYLKLKEFDLKTNSEKTMDIPKSNVLQFFTKDGSKISVRPSGTEPKIKFYFSVNSKLERREDYDLLCSELHAKIEKIKTSLGLE